MDRISKLPEGIIETILCYLPIQEAARTSILSKGWRYHWLKIPKLAFIKDTFEVSNRFSVLEQTFERTSKRKRMAKSCKLFYAIYQVLLMHQGPIHEFTLSLRADKSYVEIDHILLHLSKKNTVKSLKLDLSWRYKLPLSLFSFNQLTDLYLSDCVLDHQPSSIVFGSLTTLHLHAIRTSVKVLLRFLSSCPSLKILNLMSDSGTIDGSGDFTIDKLFECFPVVESLGFPFFIFTTFVPDRLPKELPTTLVHLKYLYMQFAWFRHKCSVPFLLLLIKASPNLQKLKIEIGIDDYMFDEDWWGSFILEDNSDIMLEHLTELEFIDFSNEENELVVVKLILARSPVLKNVKILLWDEFNKDEKLQIKETLLSFPCASPDVKIIVT